GLLSTAGDHEEAYEAIRALTRSSEYRERLVHRAQRHIWATATYSHRAAQVMRHVGVDRKVPEKAVSFVVSSNRPDHLETIFRNVARQSLEEKELILLTHGFEPDREQLESLRADYGLANVTQLSAPTEDSLGKNLNRAFAAAAGDVLMRM